MRGLLAKELRALVPLGALGILVMSGDLLYRPILERHDQATWTRIADYVRPGEGSTLGLVLLILATSVAYAAYPREHDERTIELLASLPIRRSTIFAAKVLAGLLVLWTMCAALLLTDAVQSTLGVSSLSGDQWRLALALQLTALQAALCAIAYAHALLASVLRLFGLVPYALVLVMANLLEDALPILAWIDPCELLVARYEGRDLVVPWVPLAIHAAVALAALGLAYLAWSGPAERIGRALERLRESVAGKLAFGCASAAALGFLGLVTAGVLVGGMPDDPETREDDDTLATSQRATVRYVFTYPSGLEGRATPLIDAADGIHESVRLRLGAPVGPRLVADLTDTSREHLGIASWTHLRVGLVTERDPVRLRRTFAHETAHAFQHVMSDGRHGPAARLFFEGSAEHLAFLVVPDDELLRRARVIAAAAWTRHRMRFEDLADDERLRARFDPALVYAIGELWTAALVETHGERAIGDVLRAMARPEARRDLGPRAYWEELLRAAGCDLEATLATFERTVASIAERERASIERLPRIGGGVAGASGASVRVVAQLDRDADPTFTYWLRVRSGPEAGDTETVGVPGQVDARDPRRVTFSVHRALVPSARFQILFSVRPGEQGWAWSETWQWATAP
ncbi:MAG TPA: ABC transporter permease subunit [Sandaracinaceae bacterium]